MQSFQSLLSTWRNFASSADLILRHTSEAATQSYQSSLSTWRNLGPFAIKNVPSVESDQTVNAYANLNLHDAHVRSLRSILSFFVVGMKKLCILGYQKCAQWRFWSDCMNAQTYLNFHWAHITEGMFSDVTADLETQHCLEPTEYCNMNCNSTALHTALPSTKKYSWTSMRGWSGGAKVLCILHHWGVQLILAYSWARPAILVVGKGRGGMFLFLLFLHFHSCSSFFPVPLFHLLYSLFYLFSPFLWETTQNDPQGLTCR